MRFKGFGEALFGMAMSLFIVACQQPQPAPRSVIELYKTPTPTRTAVVITDPATQAAIKQMEPAVQTAIATKGPIHLPAITPQSPTPTYTPTQTPPRTHIPLRSIPTKLAIRPITEGNSASWSPDGKYLAVYRDTNRSIVLVDTITLDEKRVANLRTDNSDISNDSYNKTVPSYWCPVVDIVWIDDQNLVFNRNPGSGGEIFHLSLRDNAVRKLYTEYHNFDGQICGMALTPDSKNIVYGTTIYKNDHIKLADALGGRSRSIYSGHAGRPQVSPDGQVYFLSGDTGTERLHLVRVNSNGLSPTSVGSDITPQRIGQNLSLSISPYGQLLIGYDNTLIFQSLNSRDKTTLKVPLSAVYNAKFSPNGDEILFSTSHTKTGTIYSARLE